MLRKLAMKSLKVLRLGSQLMLLQENMCDAVIANCEADDFAFIRVKFRFCHM